MTIWRRDINPALLDWIAVPGMHSGEPACSGEDAGQMTALFGSPAANMQHDEHGGGKIIRQRSGSICNASTPPADAPITTMSCFSIRLQCLTCSRLQAA